MIVKAYQEERQEVETRTKAVITPLVLIGFSALYFVDVCLRASEKYFWYDELLTLYFARFPNWDSLWKALSTGIESNPPLFHLLTRGVQAVFGEGLVGTRLPEIVGFWVFCVSLFVFVNRRAGPIAGAVGMALPALTGAYFYAYEARPHAVIMGFCGIALLLWDAASRRPLPNRYLVGFSFCLLAAFMLHCYAIVLAVPFAIAEIVRTLKAKRVAWSVWIALLAPAIPACLLYLPLLRFYRVLITGSAFAKDAPAIWAQVPGFYLFLFGPVFWLPLLMFLLLAIHSLSSLRNSVSAKSEVLSLTNEEVALAVSFAALPLFGVILGKIVHGPFFGRYFLSALIGVCILIGITLGRQGIRRWTTPALATLMLLSLTGSLARLGWHRLHGWPERLVEPSSIFLVDSTPGDPLESHSVLISDTRRNLPVLVLNPLDFLYLVHYAPALTPRLYYASLNQDDFFYRGYEKFRAWCPEKYNAPVSYIDFAKSHPDFLTYGTVRYAIRLTNLTRIGAEITSLSEYYDHFLAEVKLKSAGAKLP